MALRQKITPFLWFQNQAEEAARFYVALFQDSEIEQVSHYGETGPGPKGSVMAVKFRLEGQSFVALNGGTNPEFSQAVSFYVECADQAEIDRLWDGLADGGKPIACGWITDRFGVTWQINFDGILDMVQDPDPARSGRAMREMMTMQKIDIARLRAAYEGS